MRCSRAGDFNGVQRFAQVVRCRTKEYFRAIDTQSRQSLQKLLLKAIRDIMYKSKVCVEPRRGIHLLEKPFNLCGQFFKSHG